MIMKVPDFFNIKSGRSKNNYIPLVHHVKTTSDFFRLKPILCREVVPGDDMKVTVRSFCRMTPMPFPTFGRIKFHNKVFFVPYRLIMEGFTHFIEDVNYPTSSGLISLSSVPFFSNKSLAETLLYYSQAVSDEFYWRPKVSSSGYSDRGQILCNSYGEILEFSRSGYKLYFILNSVGELSALQFPAGGIPTGYELTFAKYGTSDRGTFTVSYVSQDNLNYFNITDSDLQDFYRFKGVPVLPSADSTLTNGDFVAETVSSVSYTLPPISSLDFDSVAYDFKYGDTPYRFSNQGRIFYDLD